MTTTSIETTVQFEASDDDVPDADVVVAWISAAGECTEVTGGEVTVRFVDPNEMRELNKKFREKDAVTNVLSFPFESPPGIDLDILGDIVVCADVVREEAIAYDTTPLARYAHMVVHGFLHLVGFDHIERSDAAAMEQAETTTLCKLGFPDPWVPEGQAAPLT